MIIEKFGVHEEGKTETYYRVYQTFQDKFTLAQWLNFEDLSPQIIDYLRGVHTSYGKGKNLKLQELKTFIEGLCSRAYETASNPLSQYAYTMIGGYVKVFPVNQQVLQEQLVKAKIKQIALAAKNEITQIISSQSSAAINLFLPNRGDTAAAALAPVAAPAPAADSAPLLRSVQP